MTINVFQFIMNVLSIGCTLNE